MPCDTLRIEPQVVAQEDESDDEEEEAIQELGEFMGAEVLGRFLGRVLAWDALTVSSLKKCLNHRIMGIMSENHRLLGGNMFVSFELISLGLCFGI